LGDGGQRHARVYSFLGGLSMTRIISEYAEVRSRFLRLVSEISQAFSGFEDTTDPDCQSAKDLDSLIESLQQPEFVIAVVGVIKRGKSTFINAFLETIEEIVSTNVTPETARLSYLLYGVEPHAIIHKKDGSAEKIPIRDIAKHTSAFGSGILKKSRGEKHLVEQTMFAEIRFPNRYLKDGVILVDTPGVDDPNIERSLITENFVAKADAVIFMIDVLEGGLKESELRFLKSRLINKKSSKGIICVCNKILALRKHQQQELPKLIDSTKEKLAKELDIQVPVYPIDALAAFNGIRENDTEKYQQSNFKDFLQAFESNLINIKGKVMLKKRLVEFHTIIETNLASFQFQQKATTQNLVQLQSELSTAEKKLTAQTQFFKEYTNRIKKERDGFQSWIEQTVRREFSDIVVSEKLGPDHVHGQVARALQGLNSLITQRLNKVLRGYIGEINAENIVIPELTFQADNLDFSFDKYQTSQVIQEKESLDWSAAITAAGIGAVAGAIVPGIGSVMGGLIGLFLPVIDREMIEREVTHFDTAGLRKELSRLVDQLVESYLDNSSSAFDEFLQLIDEPR